MAKIRISSTELVWVFHQRLEAFYDCRPEVPIAIVPDDGSWMAVMSAKVRGTLIGRGVSRVFRNSFERFTF
jgi:hypothetical protein